MRTNFFSTPLKPFDPASETWPVRGLFEAFSNREFETAGIETLLAFVQSGLSNLTPDGLVSLLPKEEGCDGDARIDLVYTPSYATAAAGMYLLLTRPSAVDEKTEQELQSLMNRAFANGIPGHGYGADRYRREVLFMFALAGAKQFLEKHPDFCPGMADALNRQMELVKARPEGESDWTNLKNLTDLSIRTLAAWEGNTEPVFVYGTLMQGQSAHAYMDGSTFAGKAILRGFAIYNLGWYPGIVPTEKEAVFGELYYISKSRLPEMDRYEGVGSLYERKTVPVETRYGKTDANAYIYLKELPSKPIEDGRWESRDSDPVWYACYGSNLNEERFKDYILGNEHPKWGSRKDGCHDKTLWQDSAVKEYPGQLYFGNSSGQWDDAGVAFYDPEKEGKTFMRLYKITFGQLLDVWKQEGKSETWYDSLYPLEITDDEIPVYTITSKKRKAFNMPSEKYREIIQEALVHVCGLGNKSADKYLRQALKQ